MSHPVMSDEALETLERDTLGYFLKETNPRNGLVPDSTRTDAPCSIAAVGMALAAYVVGADREFISRADAVGRTLTTLRFFWNSPQGEAPDATGHMGFYYHFLDMQTGRRTWNSELSTIDTTILIAGALLAARYFDRETEPEREIRAIADALYRRMNWQWAQNGGVTVSHGWRPKRGFLRYRWEGYNEAILLYVLALGSPTYPIPTESYQAWTKTYRWKTLYGTQFLYAGPLFIHQLSHIWIDFRGIQDDFMRGRGSDYFENSRRATYVQQAYAIRNPKAFKGYGKHSWGFTASDGPGPATRTIDGVKRRFLAYRARGIPYGPDDGTIAPWVAIAALPFAPEIVLPTLHHFNEAYPEMNSRYGFKCSFNPTFSDGKRGIQGWISKGYYGLDQGPVVMMIENYRSGLVWKLMREDPFIVRGLQRAGFAGGWL
jgi:hypothetical protein